MGSPQTTSTPMEWLAAKGFAVGKKLEVLEVDVKWRKLIVRVVWVGARSGSTIGRGAARTPMPLYSPCRATWRRPAEETAR